MSSPKDEDPKTPDWGKVPDLIEQGFHLRIKKGKNETQYITMRKGDQERSLGRYTEEAWSNLLALYPKLKKSIEQKKKRTEGKGTLTKMMLQKPQALKSSSNISLETLAWYEWAQSKGFTGTLGDFLNEVVSDYFRKEGLVRPVVIVREAPLIVQS